MDYASQNILPHAPSAGFTLIELLITLAVLSIVLGLGIPGISALTESSRLRAVTHNLTSAIQLARSEAVNRRTTTAVCQINTNASACDFTASWRNGWIVVVANQPGANLQVAAGVTVVRRWEGINLAINGGANGLVFESSGRSLASSQLDTDSGSDKRCLFVSTTGRIAVVDDDDDPNDRCA